MNYLGNDIHFYARYQATLFERASEDKLPSFYFANKFMHSLLVSKIDQKQIELTGISNEEIYQSVLSSLTVENGTIFPSCVMHWIGYVYRAIVNYTNYPSSYIFKKVPISYLSKVYYPYHTQDVEKAVKLIIADRNIEILDVHERMRRILATIR